MINENAQIYENTKISQTFKTNNVIYFDAMKSHKPYKER